MSTTLTSTLRPSRPLPHQERIPGVDTTLGNLRLRFARDESDLEAVQALRYRVFNLELSEGLEGSHHSGRDEDRFDAQCQHLMVLELETDEVVGTYRMQVAESARDGHGFYSDSEFDLSGFGPEVLENSIELGRACIAKQHRNRIALFLLWRGLANYVVHTRKTILFGCSSLTSQDPAEGLSAYDQLDADGHLHPVYDLATRDAFRIDEAPHDGIQVTIPPLFGIYLRHGAKICGRPAIDREFGTIDFLTLLDAGAMDPKVFQSFAG
jgi:putative hemolysin